MPLHSLAMRRDIPVTFLGHTKNRQQQWQSLCSDSIKTPRPDFIFVACFPEKLPAVTRQWPRHKSINLHPSLLPKYRGPDPIFWQLRHNETQTGISLHELSEQWDAGAILHQQDVAFPAGASRAELNTLLAQQGALAFIHLITKGTLSAREQDATQASYFPLATENDYLIDPDWTAEQTNNFIRGNDLTA